MKVASLSLWVFEHLITMDMEITHIWESPNWSIIKILFVYTRYSTYVDVALGVIVQFLPPQSSSSCKVTSYATIWCLIIGVTFSDLILTLRVWAVWNKTRIMTIMLAVCYTSIVIPLWVFAGVLGNAITCAYN
ncbi:hypothetical protein BDQ17DRAFT_1432736 [Cyathus striatus]|nr:hypothetical protein BDQ17DRAFT_1439179 [Cyathus striatus]KAF8991935.1 hypothetical protein BDQ17DRAFT_1432736 [Cyathus striatus]